MKRRKFIKKSSLATIMLALHPESCIFDIQESEKANEEGRSKIDLISNIRLLTSRPLEEMKRFYIRTLGLSLLEEKTSEVTFGAGGSTITFVKIDSKLGDPWYHFAFNIPENKIIKAREWQLKRTALIPTPKRLRDSSFPDDIRHFGNWNAHSVFFYDPAGNLLEYIARHDLNNGIPGDFASQDILNVSEIAFVVDNQEAEAKKLGTHLDLNVYPKTTDFWWSMGDENGLLLCIPKRIFGENTPHPKRFNVYNTEAQIIGRENKEYTFKDLPYRVIMNASETLH